MPKWLIKSNYNSFRYHFDFTSDDFYYYHFPIITILFQCTEETFGSRRAHDWFFVSFLPAPAGQTSETVPGAELR